MPSLWYKSRNIEWDVGPYPAANAQAYFFLGGVEGTAITVYADAAESSPLTNPVVADGNGRWPAVYIPYMDSFGVRVLNEANVQLWLDDLIPNPNPVEVNVDPPATGGVETGMFHWEPIQAVKAGYVRSNGRSIGNAASSATERANADTEDLFLYLWNALADAQAAVLPGGRGASAIADFAANKRLSLPDMRGAIMVGLDDMGGVAGSTFTGITFASGNATTPGSAAGANSYSLTTGQMPIHTHTGAAAAGGDHSHGGATGNDSPGHIHNINFASGAGSAHSHSGTTGLNSNDHTHTFSATTSTAGAHTHTVQTAVASAGTQDIPQRSTGVAAGTTPTTSNGDHSHTVSGTTSTISANHNHNFTTGNESAHTHTISGNSAAPTANHTHAISASGTHTHTISIDNAGSGSAVTNLPKAILGTWYIKL